MKSKILKVASVVVVALASTMAFAGGKPRVTLPLDIAVSQKGSAYEVALTATADRPMTDLLVQAEPYRDVSMLPVVQSVSAPKLGDRLEVFGYASLAGGVEYGYLRVRVSATVDGVTLARTEVVRVGSNPTQSTGMQQPSSAGKQGLTRSTSLTKRPTKVVSQQTRGFGQ